MVHALLAWLLLCFIATFHPSFLPSCLPSFLPSFPASLLFIFLALKNSPHKEACRPIHPPIHISTNLPTYPSIHLSTFAKPKKPPPTKLLPLTHSLNELDLLKKPKMVKKKRGGGEWWEIHGNIQLIIFGAHFGVIFMFMGEDGWMDG